VTASPYSYTWTEVPAGSYSLTAKATSAARTITVNANQAPTVGLTSPTEGQSFTAPATVTLTANATDTDGTIAKVEFYRGTTLIGTSTNSPYSVTWTDAPAGSYSLTAKATDDKGAVTTSTARTVTVEGTVVSGNVYYIHTDHLDTPREITNEQNQTIWKNPPLTEPFGMTPVDDDPDGDGQTFTFNLRFPGQYYDQETGTHYNYYRDNYLPDFGRYGQSDPIGLEGGINTYGYANNNPLIFVDSTGKLAGAIITGGIIVGGFYLLKQCMDRCLCVERDNDIIEIDGLTDGCNKEGYCPVDPASRDRYGLCAKYCVNLTALWQTLLDGTFAKAKPPFPGPTSTAETIGQEIGKKIEEYQK
jgi:RHS repeat-associated protein